MRDTVLIVGAGAMGSSIGCCAAVAGNRVLFYDSDDQARQTVLDRSAQMVADLQRYGLCSPSASSAAVDNLAVASSLPDAAADAFVVIEAIYENLEAKQAVFASLDSLVPTDVPILSNTSGLRISDIAASTAHPERTLTAHFWLPAHLVPLVEIVIGDQSSPALAEQVKELLTGWGKAPVIVKRDLPGQLANRVLQAIIREAVNIVEIGLASPEDVDTAIKMGMALRFPVWGPLEHVDAVGLDLCAAVQDTVLPEISSRQQASPLFHEYIAQNNLGHKTGHGFYDWTTKSMDELVEARNDFIVFALKQIRKEVEA
ncbi:MAG: 3-hydroxyacyl-CoA dehydrogenase NAD-binding domain-containing protein [Propionibacteriaceae bacterium]|nr:3-hydroxyacyl-CoA dehydrogenase NAD-binding domain-containing protein [Propionibacteriaceae bacterium]